MSSAGGVFEDPSTAADDLIPAEEWYEPYLRFALYVGAVFQLVCILAVLVFPANSDKSGGVGGDADSEVGRIQLLRAARLKG